MKKVNLFLSSIVALAMIAACNNTEEATPDTTEESVEEVAPAEEVIEETETTEEEVQTEVVETASAAKPASQTTNTTAKSDKVVDAATDKTVNTSDSKTALQEAKEVVEESLDPNAQLKIQDGENRIKEKIERKKGK